MYEDAFVFLKLYFNFTYLIFNVKLILKPSYHIVIILLVYDTFAFPQVTVVKCIIVTLYLIVPLHLILQRISQNPANYKQFMPLLGKSKRIPIGVYEKYNA